MVASTLRIQQSVHETKKKLFSISLKQYNLTCLCVSVERCPLLYTRHLSQAPARRIGDVTPVSCATGFVFVDGDWSKTLSCLDAASDIGQWSLNETELGCRSKNAITLNCQLFEVNLALQVQ